MSHNAEDDVGAENAKVPDTEIQGVKAGERNRAAREAGVMPPPAGESRSNLPDPRRDSSDKKRRVENDA